MSFITKAVLLAAGRGTRMGNLTDQIPKPMIEVRGKPILLHIVEGLKKAGITDVLFIVGYHEEVIREFFQEGSAWGISASYVQQTQQEGTGRAAALGRDFTKMDSFILSYGDILLDPVNYELLTASHKTTDEATLLVVKNQISERAQGGAVFVDEEFQVLDLIEKPQPHEPQSPWYNAGVYRFSSSVYESLERLQKSPRGEYELTDAIRDLMARQKRVRALELQGLWADVRDAEVLAHLQGIRE